MALIMRRGAYEDFDPNKMLPAEWAIVLSGDPIVTDGKSVFLCFSAGDVKRIATYDDMVRQFGDMTEELIQELTDGVNVVIVNAQSAASYANNAGASAYEKSQAAETAANTAQAVADQIDAMLENGELTGPPGPAGEKGNDGAVVTLDGQYAFQIKGDGHLYLIYTEGSTPPDMYINDDGHLILKIGGE